MTATDELRRLLDERGVEWRKTPHYSSDSVDNETVFCGEGIEWLAHDHLNGKIGLKTLRYEITPEQAIAATLGSCNCSNDCTNSERTGTCHADETGRFSFHVWNGGPVTVHVMECSECGRTYEHVNGDYEFCPRCGRKVVTNG